MGGVVSKKMHSSIKDAKFNTSRVSEKSSQPMINANSNRNALRQYIEDEERIDLFTSTRNSLQYQNTSNTSLTNSNMDEDIKNRTSNRYSGYVGQYDNTEVPDHHHTKSFTLPDNWESKEYQYKLHFALKALFKGNVTQSVSPMLKDGSRVIQMGISTSPWIMDMATQNPGCVFIGIDLSFDESQIITPILQNVKFIQPDTIDYKIDIKDNSIDYIHLRSAGLYVTLDKWPLIFKEINRVLKPNGVIRIEELHHSPTGTVMIESFVETVKSIFCDLNQDANIACKYGKILKEQGFQIIDQQKKKVHYASDGKLSKEFLTAILNLYISKGPEIAPRLGLDHEDYRHRIEDICTECVRKDSFMEWYSWVGKKGAIKY